MIDLMVIYNCKRCGEVLEDQVDQVEMIDHANDEVWVENICVACNGSVEQKYYESDGEKLPCYEKVDHERWLWANRFYDDDQDR